MANVRLVNAKVTRIIPGNRGFVASEFYKDRMGNEKENKFTVWTGQPVELGQQVSLDGLLSVRMEEFTNEEGNTIRYAASHINEPTMIDAKQAPYTSIGSAPAAEVPF